MIASLGSLTYILLATDRPGHGRIAGRQTPFDSISAQV